MKKIAKKVLYNKRTFAFLAYAGILKFETSKKAERSKEVIISIDRTRLSTRQWMIHTREWHYRSQQLFFNRYLLCPDDAVTETILKILDSNSSSLHDLGSVQVQEDCGCR
jgi:hypothetical protein